MLLKPSPIETYDFFDQPFFIKRDDQLHPQFSGNKARKFASLLNQQFTEQQLIIGYGSPQANSLYSLAALAKLKSCRLDFYVDHIPGYLKQNPQGNYFEALQLGAQIIEIGEQRQDLNLSMDDYLESVVVPQFPNALLIPEGGRCSYAQPGVYQLGEEIEDWRVHQQIPQINILLPAGTGTTALYLSQYVKQQQLPITVFTCPCVAGVDYLEQQFLSLSTNRLDFPEILSPPRKYHFGKLYREHIEIWLSLREQIPQIHFELLYDPIAWHCLGTYSKQLPKHIPLLYIHQGGLQGNQSMLSRYQRKFPDLADKILKYR